MRAGLSAIGAICGTVAALATSGCSSTPTPAAIQSWSPAGSSSPALSATAAAQEAIVTAYTTFNQVSGAAERAAPAQAREMLAPYVAEPYLDHLLAQMDPYRARHEAASGYVTPHVTQVTINGNGALVRDCQDDSRAALADTRTGKVLPGTYGSVRTSLVATLTRGGDGHWRMTALEQLDTSCEPGPSPS